LPSKRIVITGLGCLSPKERGKVFCFQRLAKAFIGRFKEIEDAPFAAPASASYNGVIVTLLSL
jgi:hypothetical protein